MSSCQRKNVNVERFQPNRTPLDQVMARMYNPVGEYAAAPWPMQRTVADLRLQKEFCPSCGTFVPDVRPNGQTLPCARAMPIGNLGGGCGQVDQIDAMFSELYGPRARAVVQPGFPTPLPKGHSLNPNY